MTIESVINQYLQDPAVSLTLADWMGYIVQRVGLNFFLQQKLPDCHASLLRAVQCRIDDHLANGGNSDEARRFGKRLVKLKKSTTLDAVTGEWSLRLHERVVAQATLEVARVGSQTTAVEDYLRPLKRLRSSSPVSEASDKSIARPVTPDGERTSDDDEYLLSSQETQASEEDEEDFVLVERKTFVEKQLRALERTILPSGKTLEGVMAELAIRLDKESPMHSFIFDLDKIRELMQQNPSIMNAEDFSYVSLLWENRPSAQFFKEDIISKHPQMKEIEAFITELKKIADQKPTVNTALEQVLRLSPPIQWPGPELYKVVLDFILEWRRNGGSRETEADYMRKWNSLFQSLAPLSVNTTPPEETVRANKERRLRNAYSEEKNIHGRQADMVWVTEDGDELVWLEAKKGTWTDNPGQAEEAVLKATKGSKDLLDSILRRTNRNVECWACVNLRQYWTLRGSFRLDSGLVVTGDIQSWTLPSSILSFSRLVKLCSAVICWGWEARKYSDWDVDNFAAHILDQRLFHSEHHTIAYIRQTVMNEMKLLVQHITQKYRLKHLKAMARDASKDIQASVTKRQKLLGLAQAIQAGNSL
ncbi:hypothetical protein HDU85_006026 [Gaertneriomyces sp. JEL0708]|nr:hypothetical protein HDU85_006026 [Gaertneriomyces sp. JEL0708]